MIELRLSRHDLVRCRFAISPLLETAGAVRALANPALPVTHLPWWRDAQAASVPGLDVLRALTPTVGYTPDFLTPPPETPHTGVEAELARVAATPPELAELEIRRSLHRRQAPAALHDLLADPATLPARVAELLAAAWHRLIRPHWGRIRDLLEADIAHRSRRLTNNGLGPVLAHLHSKVRWDGDRLQVIKPATLRRDLRGEGLLLVPSALEWPAVRIQLNPPWQPTLTYPSRGVGTLWEHETAPRDAVDQLLGRTRAQLLRHLATSAATSELARRLDLAPATVSHHLKAMHHTGLLRAQRDGRFVRYERTPLGDALLRSGRP